MLCALAINTGTQISNADVAAREVIKVKILERYSRYNYSAHSSCDTV